MKTQLIWHGREVLPDEEIDLPDEAARRYVATDQAEFVDSKQTPQIEAATVNRTSRTASRDMRAPQHKGK